MTVRPSPGGVVVVLFGSATDGWCSLNKCPLGSVEWFKTDTEARAYADSVPEGFEPHILRVYVDPSLTDEETRAQLNQV